MESVKEIEIQSAIRDDLSDSTISSLSAVAARGGVFHSGRHAISMEDIGAKSDANSSSSQRVLTRKVGAQYLMQVLLTGLPLLVVDIVALTVTICALRILFFELGFVV